MYRRIAREHGEVARGDALGDGHGERGVAAEQIHDRIVRCRIEIVQEQPLGLRWDAPGSSRHCSFCPSMSRSPTTPADGDHNTAAGGDERLWLDREQKG